MTVAKSVSGALFFCSVLQTLKRCNRKLREEGILKRMHQVSEKNMHQVSFFLNQEQGNRCRVENKYVDDQIFDLFHNKPGTGTGEQVSCGE